MCFPRDISLSLLERSHIFESVFQNHNFIQTDSFSGAKSPNRPTTFFSALSLSYLC